MRLYASQCHSYAIICQAIAFHRIAFPRIAFPLHGTANLSPAMPLPLVACQNFASPLPIKTVLCIPSLCYAKPCQTLHGCAMPLRIIAILSRCESMSINAVPLLIDARPLLRCSNQHLRITQSFTGSLCHSLCYPELSHCHSALSKSVALQSTNCRRYQYHHHSCVHVPTCAGL